MGDGTPGPGRPKGSKDVVPRTFKASVKAVLEKIQSEDPGLIEKAIRKGLAGNPREAFVYVQLAAHYFDGKPIETIKGSMTHTHKPYAWLPPQV